MKNCFNIVINEMSFDKHKQWIPEKKDTKEYLSWKKEYIEREVQKMNDFWSKQK